MGLFRKKKGTAGFIKHGTAGTSNEISFSVLDQMASHAGISSQIDPEDIGKPELFTMPGKKEVGSTPTRDNSLPINSPSAIVPVQQQKTPLSADDEVVRRKRKRLLSRVLFATAAVLAVAALLFVGGRYVYEDYQNNQTYIGVLKQAFAEINEADETLGLMDASFAQLLSEESLSQMEQAQLGFDACKKHLEDAEVFAGRAAANFTGAEEKEVSAQAQNAISARLQMIEVGAQIIEKTLLAHRCIVETQSAWEKLLAGDTAVRNAVNSITNLDAETVVAAKNALLSAQSLFEQAKTAYSDVATAYENLDYTAYTNYIDTRLEAISHLLAALDAVSAQDTVAAAEHMERYNATDAQAASLALSLQEDNSQAVKEILFEQLQSLSEQYENVCSQAAKADEVLRNYINSNA